MPQMGSLGRGMDAVAAPPQDEGAGENVQNLRVDLIDPNPDQPREVFDPEALEDLEASIAVDGILQPIVVRPAGDRYQLVMGERRLRAAANSGRRSIPAIVRDVSDPKMLELSLVENIQRENLNPMERARAYKNMMDTLTLTQEEAARRLGVGRANLANFMRLLELPEEIQEHVSRGTISMGHARALLAVKGKSRQIQAAKKIVEKGLSVRQTELLSSAGTRKKSAGKKPLPPDIQNIEDLIREALGTKVTIKGTGSRGKIVVEYFSGDDLQRILEKVCGSQP